MNKGGLNVFMMVHQEVEKCEHMYELAILCYLCHASQRDGDDFDINILVEEIASKFTLDKNWVRYQLDNLIEKQIK